MRHRSGFTVVIGAAALAIASLAGVSPAAAQSVVEVSIKNHVFTPSDIHVPAGKPAVLHIRNEDPLAEEFESSALKIEKVIAGGHDANVRLRPLEKGRYPFKGEYHANTAKGVVIAE
jgi:plastocyanin